MHPQNQRIKMTYRECYEKGCLALQTAGIEEATLDARLLLEAVCGTNRNDLLVHGEQLVTDRKSTRLNSSHAR